MTKYKIFSLNSVDFFIKDLSLDIEGIKKSIKEIPNIFYSKIKNIIIHSSNTFDAKGVDAFIRDETIEINSKILNSIHEFKKTLIHELYHSIETDLKQFLVDTFKDVEIEFLQKKKKLLDKISNDPRFSKPNNSFYKSTEHDYEFDDFLSRKIGYHILDNKIIDIFPSPYAITSIDEYIAICIEIFFFERREWVVTYCPKVANLINELRDK